MTLPADDRAGCASCAGRRELTRQGQLPVQGGRIGQAPGEAHATKRAGHSEVAHYHNDNGQDVDGTEHSGVDDVQLGLPVEVEKAPGPRVLELVAADPNKWQDSESQSHAPTSYEGHERFLPGDASCVAVRELDSQQPFQGHAANDEGHDHSEGDHHEAVV